MPAHTWTLTVRGFDDAANSQRWEYTAVRGTPANPAADVQIIPPFTYEWEHADGQIPGRLNPATVSVSFAATSRATLPAIAPGDVIESVLYGSWWTSDPNEIVRTPARVTDVGYSFDPAAEKYPARMTITAADILTDLAADNTPTRPALDFVREQSGRPDESAVTLGQLLTAQSLAAGYRLIVPNALGKHSSPFAYNGGSEGTADELLTRALNSTPVSGQHLAAAPCWNVGPWPPAALPANHWTNTDWSGNTAAFHLSAMYPPIPESTRPAYILQPHDRQLRGTVTALDRLALAGSMYTIEPLAPDLATLDALAIVPAAAVNVPVNATLTAPQSPTVINLDAGIVERGKLLTDPWPDRTGTVPVRVVAGSRRTARDVPTALDLARDDRRARPTDVGRVTASASAAAAVFTPAQSDAGAIAFDRFEIVGDYLPTDAGFARLFRRLTPRPYRSPADPGHLTAAVVVTDVADALDLPANRVTGYAAAGTLTIADGGRITYTITLAPGALELADNPGVYTHPGPPIAGIVTYQTAPTAWTFANSAGELTADALKLTAPPT